LSKIKNFKNIDDYEDIKNIDTDNEKREPPPFEDEKRRDVEKKGYKPLIWFAFYDKELNLLNSNNLAKSYPLKLKKNDLSKKYFKVNFENIAIDDMVFFHDGNITTSIAKVFRFYTNKGEIYYVKKLDPFSKESDYIKKLESLIIKIFFIFIALFFIAGYFYAKYSLSPIKKIQNQLNNISDQDLTKRIIVKNEKDEVGELSKTINNLLGRLEKAFLMEKQFVSDVSHEFKTPISILRLSIENMINDEKFSDAALETLGQDLEILYSMDFLVKKLLYLSKLEQSIIPFNPRDFNLSEIVLAVVKNLDYIAINKNIKINTVMEEKINIKGDKELIYIALYNIVENALKYTEKGMVSITVTVGNNITIMEVEDAGKGIPEEKIDKIFDRFYRADESRKINEGYGIGLTIVKRIIDFHKGKIEVLSRFGYGSKFKITLPKLY